MALSAGTRLGPYEIVALIGAGGMGEVYSAHDPRMGRDVAIKVSAERFSDRFSREVHAVAALNHPNICHLYDVGPDYLVMELVEGPTLAERIQQGAVPLEKALGIAKQIAEALGAAHEKGIVHRDLKPGNIKIRPDGTVKVLDFGLAKVAPASDGESKGENSPTISMGMTQAGVILGTAAYMPPEQARGKPVDKRADIWAFGVVLYEMLSGKRLFDGEDASHTLAAVIMQEPQWDAIPIRVLRMLKCCLEKDPRHRLRDIGDAWRLLEELPAPSHGPWTSRTWLWPAVAVLLMIGASALAWVHFREKPPVPEVTRLSLLLPEKSRVHSFGLSPDGRDIAMALEKDGKRQLWLRSLAALDPRVLAGTDGASNPFWSPDSRFIAFFADGKLKKIDKAGGPAQALCNVPGTGFVFGTFGTWSRHGAILFSAGSALKQVSSEGGVPADLTTSGSRYRSPVFLPDGRHFFSRFTRSPDLEGIVVGSLDGEKPRRILADDSNPQIVSPMDGSHIGQLLFVRDTILMVQPFDLERLQPAGGVFPVAENIALGRNGEWLFQASGSGVLAYVSGAAQTERYTWYDRQGRNAGVAGEPGLYNGGTVSVSPDGKRLAGQRRTSAAGTDVWISDLARGVDTRITFGPTSQGYPIWSPDGSQVAYQSMRDGKSNIYRKLANGAGSEALLLKTNGSNYPRSWSPDGRFILYQTSITDPGAGDVMALPLEGERKPFPVVQTAAYEGQPQFSPDGHWVAYTSNESGQNEVYVVPFPPSTNGGKWVVSKGGGVQPRWRRDGRELFYISPDNKLTAVEVTTVHAFQPGVPHTLFQTAISGGGGINTTIAWDVTPDGRFLIISDDVSAVLPLTVTLNWQAGLKK